MIKRKIIIVIILGLLCILVVTNKITTPTTQELETEPINSNIDITYNKDGSFRLIGTYEDLITLNEELYCTYTQDSRYGQLSGTYYLESAESHLDQIRIKQATNVTWFNISLLLKDGRLYTWGDVQPKGEGAVQDFVTKREDGASEISPLIYECTPQKIDSKILEIPSDIAFRERYDINPPDVLPTP